MTKLRLGLNSVIAVLCVVLVVLLVYIFYPKREEFLVKCSKQKSGKKKKKYRRKQRELNLVLDLDSGIIKNSDRNSNPNLKFSVFRDGGGQQLISWKNACESYRRPPNSANKAFSRQRGKWFKCPKRTYTTKNMVRNGTLQCLDCPQDFQGRENLRNLMDGKSGCVNITTQAPTTQAPTNKAPDMSYDDCKDFMFHIWGEEAICDTANPQFIKDCLDNGACNEKSCKGFVNDGISKDTVCDEEGSTPECALTKVCK